MQIMYWALNLLLPQSPFLQVTSSFSPSISCGAMWVAARGLGRELLCGPIFFKIDQIQVDLGGHLLKRPSDQSKNSILYFTVISLSEQIKESNPIFSEFTPSTLVKFRKICPNWDLALQAPG